LIALIGVATIDAGWGVGRLDGAAHGWHGIMFISKARERDIVGNIVPENTTAAEERLVGTRKKSGG